MTRVSRVASSPASGLLLISGLLIGCGRPQPSASRVESARLGSFQRCAEYGGLPPGWRRDPLAGMRDIPGGMAEIGSERGYADERPVHSVPSAPFWMDATEVTNAQFAAFVADTGYVTGAERLGDAAVFVAPSAGTDATPATWWQMRRGADWRHPEGAGSTIDTRASEPVVQVTRADAVAYARWLGRDLPSEAEWERAAKAGRDNDSADAALFDATLTPQANFWQGDFPFVNTALDRYVGRAPVGCYAANGYGLYDTIGNVWEWTGDEYAGAHQLHGQGSAAHATPATSSPSSNGTAVIKGGSYLCAESYCVRYRASARYPQEVDLPTSHVGFRTVLRQH